MSVTNFSRRHSLDYFRPGVGSLTPAEEPSESQSTGSAVLHSSLRVLTAATDAPSPATRTVTVHQTTAVLVAVAAAVSLAAVASVVASLMCFWMPRKAKNKGASTQVSILVISYRYEAAVARVHKVWHPKTCGRHAASWALPQLHNYPTRSQQQQQQPTHSHADNLSHILICVGRSACSRSPSLLVKRTLARSCFQPGIE